MRVKPRVLRHDGPFWRGLATFGASHAPRAVVRYSPPAWAFAFALAMPDARARVRKTLRLVLGPRPYRDEIVDVFRTFSHFASCLTEGLAMGADERPKVDFTVIGQEHLDAAIARERGIILVTAHTGAWEVAGPILAREFGRDLMIVMQREPDAEAREIQDRARERSGVKVVHVGDEPLAALPLLAHLRRGGALGIQIDRAPVGQRTIGVEFFGSSGRVPIGPFILARASGAPIVPAFARRLGYFRYEIELYPPLEIARDAPDGALREAAESAVREMERFIRTHPTHWFDFGQGP